MKTANNTKLDCVTARDISIVQTLARLGCFPSRESEKENWYNSPFRSETKPSFKVDRRLNRWYDHGEGIGGNVIDLVIKLSGYTIQETLRFLGDSNGFTFHKITKQKEEIAPSYQIEKVKKLENRALISYLQSRGISSSISSSCCSEMYYSMKGKTYFAVAFKNNLNGHEVRSKYFKGCLGKKAITHLKNESQKLVIFEGFIDYLSYRQLFQNDIKEDYLVLNSVALLKKCWGILSAYKIISCFLDNDDAGKKATTLIKNKYPFALDCSAFYKGSKDLNEYLLMFTDSIASRTGAAPLSPTCSARLKH